MNAYEFRTIRKHVGEFELCIEQLAFEPGNIYALVGPNGSGKTTLLDLLALLEFPHEGTLSFYGNTIDPRNSAALLDARRRIGTMMQAPYLFNTSVRANVRYGLLLRGLEKPAIQERTSAILAALSLESLANRTACSLSGGEAQRVALARTLALDSDVLLLDEPTANVDRKHIRVVETLVRERSAKAGKTVIVATHSLGQAHRLTQHVILLAGGRIRDVAYDNLFDGLLKREVGNVGTVALPGGPALSVAAGDPGPVTIAVDPTDIIVSKDRVESSALNCLNGQVAGIEEIGERVRLTVDVDGTRFTATITHTSLETMSLTLRSNVWLTFKATAVTLL